MSCRPHPGSNATMWGMSSAITAGFHSAKITRTVLHYPLLLHNSLDQPFSPNPIHKTLQQLLQSLSHFFHFYIKVTYHSCCSLQKHNIFEHLFAKQCIQVKKYLPVDKQTRMNLRRSLHCVQRLDSNLKAMSECMMAINTMYIACQDASINQSAHCQITLLSHVH